MRNGYLYHKAFEPIDDFSGTVSLQELISLYQIRDESSRNREMICNRHAYIRSMVLFDSGEQPHTIQYFATPNLYTNCMEFSALAKIENNGTTYVFTDDANLLHTIYANSLEGRYGG